MKDFILKVKSRPIVRSSVGLLTITLLVKVFGYMEKLLMAYYFGVSYQVDAFTTVFTLILAVFFFFREVIEPGFLQVFLKCKNDGDEKGAWDLFNIIGRFILSVTIPLVILVWVFPDWVIQFFVPGFQGEVKELSINLIQIAFPASFFLALSTLTAITLNGLKKFALPAFGDLALKGVIVLTLWLLYDTWGIYAAAIGIVAGAMFKLLVHLIPLFKHISFNFQLDRSQIKNVWVLTLPLLIGVSFSQISGLVDNVFASYLQEGAISALSYAKKIIELPVLVFPYVLSIVLFPYFSELAIQKEKQKLSGLLVDSLQWITLFFVPLSIFFLIFPEVITEIIFQRGAFDSSAVTLTSQPLFLYAFGLIFFAIETVLVIFYFANADTKTPIVVGICGVLINIGLTYFLIQFIGYLGIALALVISKSLKGVVLLYLLKYKLNIDSKAIISFISKVLAGSICFGITVYFAGSWVVWDDYGLVIKLATLAGIFVIGGGTYFAFLKISRIERNLKL